MRTGRSYRKNALGNQVGQESKFRERAYTGSCGFHIGRDGDIRAPLAALKRIQCIFVKGNKKNLLCRNPNPK
jgi:hypothetical protein